MENNNRRREQSLKGKLRDAVEEATSQKGGELDKRGTNPYVKTGVYISAALLAVWASQFVFSALAGAIKQFKNLRRTIREK